MFSPWCVYCFFLSSFFVATCIVYSSTTENKFYSTWFLLYLFFFFSSNTERCPFLAVLAVSVRISLTPDTSSSPSCQPSGPTKFKKKNLIQGMAKRWRLFGGLVRTNFHVGPLLTRSPGYVQFCVSWHTRKYAKSLFVPNNSENPSRYPLFGNLVPAFR